MIDLLFYLLAFVAGIVFREIIEIMCRHLPGMRMVC